MVSVTFNNLRVLQVTMNKQHTNEVTQGTFTTFNVDVEENATVRQRDGSLANRLVYHRLERVMGGTLNECDIRPNMWIHAFVDLEGYWFQDQQTHEQRAINRLKITGWQER